MIFNIFNQRQYMSKVEYINKVENCKASKDGPMISCLVTDIPKTLQDMIYEFGDETIYNYVYNQVLYHSCYGAMRTAYKNGEKLKEWSFTLPQKRTNSDAREINNFIKNANNLSPEKIEQIKKILGII